MCARWWMENISLNPTRIGFIRALQRMGAGISIELTSELPEPVGRIRVVPGTLRGVKITEAEVPSLIDELPLLAVLASQATGVTEVEGAEYNGAQSDEDNNNRGETHGLTARGPAQKAQFLDRFSDECGDFIHKIAS